MENNSAKSIKLFAVNSLFKIGNRNDLKFK